MRRAYNGSVWRDDQLDIIAVNLGSDFCAEHEWGISGITNRFGIGTKKSGIIDRLLGKEKVGIPARTISEITDKLVQFDCTIEAAGEKRRSTKQMFGLGLLSEWRSNDSSSSEFDHYIKGSYFQPQKEEVLGFWSESRFMFLLESERDVTELADAFKRKDIAIWLGASGPFKNGGLIIAIASRLPKDFVQEMEEIDLDRIELTKAAEATGIHESLKAADCEYYALSPRWKDESKKEVVFWLNPQEQNTYNFGWYGVEELKQWAEGTGPIIKTQ